MSLTTGPAIAFALLSALLNAIAAVFQQREAARQPQDQAMRPSLLLRLARNPLWLLGLTADGGAYLAEAVALGFGAVVVVSPVMQTGLLFALLLGARITHRRLARTDFLAGLALVGGLALFLGLAEPSGGITEPSWAAWWPWLLALGIGTLAAIAVGMRNTGVIRAVSLGIAAALCYGASGPLTKTVVSRIADTRWAELFLSWELPLLIACAAIGMLCNQSAFQAGGIRASLPAINIGTPVFASVIGVVVFQEVLTVTTPLEVVGVIGSVIVLLTGIFVLARREAAMQAPSEGTARP